MVFHALQVFFPQQLHILWRYKATLALNGINKTVFFQLLLGPFGRNKADPQILGKASD